MTGNPTPFSEDEKSFILLHIGPGPDHLSWKGIARELNRLYPQYNQAMRSWQGVRGWTKEFTCRYGEHIREKAMA